MRAVVLCVLVAACASSPLHQVMRAIDNGQNMNVDQIQQQVQQQALQVIRQIPLFAKLSDQQIQQFFQIAFNGTATRGDVENQLQTWAANAGVTNEWNTFKTNFNNAKSQFYTQFRAVLAGLPSAWDNIAQIDGRKDLTLKQIVEQELQALQPSGEQLGTALENFFTNAFGADFLKKIEQQQQQGSGSAPFIGGGAGPQGTFTGGQGQGQFGQGSFGQGSLGQGSGYQQGTFGGFGGNPGATFGGSGMGGGQAPQGQFGGFQQQGFGGQQQGSNGGFPSGGFVLPQQQV